MHLASHPPSVRSPGAHQMLAGLVFQRHGGLTELLNTKNIRFLGNICTYTEKPKFSIGTDVARSSLCPGRPRFASQIASVATPGAHQVVAGILLLHQVGPTLAYASPYVYSDLAYIMLWVAGGNCRSNNHYNRYRGTHR